METYEVSWEHAVENGKDYWYVYIPALDGLTHALTPSDIELMAREYIAVNLDTGLDTFGVIIREDAIPGLVNPD